MENYKANSNLKKSRDAGKEKVEKEKVEKEKVDKVVTGVVKRKKKNSILKLLLADEFVEDIKGDIISEVLVPTIKKAISDAIELMLYPGETNKGRKSLASKISYRSYYDDRDRPQSRQRIRDYSYDDIIVETRVEAEDVLDRLGELIDIYGTASIADLYDLVNISGQYTDTNYGWTDLRNATHVRVRDGYLLKLPRAVSLK